MRITSAFPPGISALLFDAARRRRLLEERLVARLLERGYHEVILPILDYVEPYEELLTGSGRTELYRFVDRDGELLALRADFTPMLARLLAPRMSSLDLPLRLFYRGDVVRYQEDHPGNQREFYQVGAELLGVDGPAADREVLELLLELVAASAALRPHLVLGFAGALDQLLLAAGGGDPVGLARAVARRQRGPARRAGRALLEIIETGTPADPDDLGPRAAGRLAALSALRDELAAAWDEVGITIDLADFALSMIDPELEAAAPERNYYNGLLFRLYVGGRALPAGAGGRYDRMFVRLGTEVSAIGFSLGIERLLAA